MRIEERSESEKDPFTCLSIQREIKKRKHERKDSRKKERKFMIRLLCWTHTHTHTHSKVVDLIVLIQSKIFILSKEKRRGKWRKLRKKYLLRFNQLSIKRKRRHTHTHMKNSHIYTWEIEREMIEKLFN